MDEVNTTLSRSRGHVMSPDGTRIAYERYGDGPPLVLVSGALCTAEDEQPLGGLLAARHTVVAYDRRGRGRSGDAPAYAVQREIEDLAALVEELGSGVAVHGTSSGAALALAAAAAGAQVTRLSVFEPPYSADPESRTAEAAHTARLTELLDQGLREAALELFLSEAMPAQALAGLRGSPAWAALLEVAPTLAYDCAVLGDGQVPTVLLAGVRTRVLVIDGGASPLWMREGAVAVAASLPRGRHRTLTGQTHMVAPHVLAPVLADFLAED